VPSLAAPFSFPWKIWVPRPRGLCEGGYSGRRKWVSVDSGYAIAKRNLGPTYIHGHRSGFVPREEAIAASSPLFRRRDQCPLHRVAMHVPLFCDALFRGPHVEVVKACLPERAWPSRGAPPYANFERAGPELVEAWHSTTLEAVAVDFREILRAFAPLQCGPVAETCWVGLPLRRA
jgi:hypothetical protein